jgi:hypothetical protein
VRTRIALATALAVTLIPTLFLTLFTSGHASAPLADGATPRHVTTARGIKVMSFADAAKLSRLATYAATVNEAQQQQYLDAMSYAAYVQANTMPAAWQATAMCEEGGRNDPNYGYFGIKAWHGFGGYRTAGSAPLSVQLAWEAAHGQGPPDAPGHCHAY